MKAIMRGLMNTAVFLLVLPFLIIAAPIVAVLWVWDRLELWAFYDNDKAKREKDRWRYS